MKCLHSAAFTSNSAAFQGVFFLQSELG
jgi:hypothetical protein